MKAKSLPMAGKYVEENRQKRRRRKTLLALIILTVLLTLYALALPAITQEKGESAHIHTEACYTQTSLETELLPVCTAQKLEIHTHSQGCYDEEGKMVCLYADFVSHVHEECCFTEDGQLWCTLPEIPVHKHDESCYQMSVTQHTHGESCFNAEGEQICTEPEETTQMVLICTQKEVLLHEHTQSCLDEAGNLQCGQCQILAHQHGDECFQQTPKRTCTDTSEEHIHTERCYGVWELSCGFQTRPSEDEEGQKDVDTDTEELPLPPQGEDTPVEEEEVPPNLGAASPGEDADEPSADEPVMPEGDAADSAVEPRDSVSITYYIYVNGTRYELNTQNVEMVKEGVRYYVTPETLETVYDSFGFHASDYQGEHIFPHTDTENPNTLWADANPEKTEEGQWRIPLATRRRIFVYYLPANTAGHSSYFTDSKSVSDVGMIAENTFYSVSVYDRAGNVQNSYVAGMQTMRLTLEKLEDYEWRFYNATDSTELMPEETEQENGEILYTIENVSHPIRVEPALKQSITEAAFTITYTANTLSSQRKNLGECKVENQYVLEEGTVNGLPVLTEQITLTKDDSYTLRTPDNMELRVNDTGYNSQHRAFYYLFQDWRVKGTETLLLAEDALSLEKLYRYAEDGKLELEAVWNPLDDGNNIRSVNFYLNLTCEIMDFEDNGFVSQPKEDFTGSLYSAYVHSTGRHDQILKEYQLLAPPTTQESAYEVDKTLREMTEVYYHTFLLSQFPSDAEIFATLRARNAKLMIDGKEIPMQYLSSDYFQIRWYVMKYETWDGWHIDGILVAKSAKLNVTKTFLGDADAVAEIVAKTGAEEYTVQVADNRDGDVFYLTLNSWEEETRNDQNYYGYSRYDAKTNTYVWNLEGHLDGTYTVTENNYLSQNMTSAAFYRIYEAANSQDWQSYSEDGVTVQMRLYSEDEPVKNYQTVAFRNYYVDAGNLRLHKVDSFTHDSMANVSFQIQSENDRLDFKLYRKPGTGMYSALTTADSQYTEFVEGNILTTDGSGDIFLQLFEGTYTLTEQFPEGYSGAEKITFSVDSNGKLTELSADGAGASSLVSGLGSTTLTVQNVSRQLTTVTAYKDWGSVPESRQKDVVVLLLARGVLLSGGEVQYTQTLNAENNWTYVWKDLPLFIDGEIAEYSVREMQIGDASYDSSVDTDGYRDYDVVYDAAKYREGDLGDYDDEPIWTDTAGKTHYANHVLLTVRNRIAGFGGEICVRKAFQTADGAQIEKNDGTYSFGLFDNAEGTGKPLKTASITYGGGTVTPENGILVFDGLRIGQTYYVFELGDDGKPIPDHSYGTIGRREFFVLGGGTRVELTTDMPTGEVVITNRMNYAPLPATGGSGYIGYMVGGLLLWMAAAWLAFAKKKAQTKC